MQLNNEQIDAIALAKANDYIRDLFADIILENYDNPTKAIALIAKKASEECTFDDTSIDKKLYEELQQSIQQKLQSILKVISERIESKDKNDY